MSKEEKYKSEDERISELESIVSNFRVRLETTEARIPLGGIQLGFGVPASLQPFFIPAVQLRGESEAVAVRESGYGCFEEVQTPISGTYDYNIANKGKDCPLPSAADKAKAVLAARGELEKFGKTWCETGNANCKSNQCEPTLSDIRVDKYELGSRPKDDAHKTCFVTAFITGTVSCKCA